MMNRDAAVDQEQLTTVLQAPSTKLAWTKFVDALTIEDDDRELCFGRPRKFNAISQTGGLGCFNMSPRRLRDLKVVKEVFVSGGKAITNLKDKRVTNFLSNPILQYEVLVASLLRYDRELNKLALPEGMTRSGALALYHRLGPNALTKWQKHQESSTKALFQRANGLF